MPAWMQIGSTLSSLAIGVGIAWGAMRSTVAGLKETVDRLDKAVEKLDEHVDNVRVELAEVKAAQKARRPKERSDA